jgi:hypothetical protein
MTDLWGGMLLYSEDRTGSNCLLRFLEAASTATSLPLAELGRRFMVCVIVAFALDGFDHFS